MLCVPSVGLEFAPFFPSKWENNLGYSNVQIDGFYMIIACEYIHYCYGYQENKNDRMYVNIGYI